MKKLLFVGVVFGALALTSCKKDYVCTYSNSTGGVEVSGEVEYSDIKNKDKDEVEKACKALGGTLKTK
ncbi:MAG TPA: hypothetical protein VL021_01645 [Brumimicrobium sp.]|nr:hypothetical protein [Flavobacterium sp.]HTO37097.1 hypothetical protein [Brumimicrobium sp.]